MSSTTNTVTCRCVPSRGLACQKCYAPHYAAGLHEAGVRPLGYVRKSAIELLRDDDEVTGIMLHADAPKDSVPVFLEPPPPEMSPEFTDTARAAIAWVLYHHQGGSSPIGQPLRMALGMGEHDPLPEWRIAEAKRYAEAVGATTAAFHADRAPVAQGPVLYANLHELKGQKTDFVACHRTENEFFSVPLHVGLYHRGLEPAECDCPNGRAEHVS